MALIPITFKADLGSDNAKGNLRAEDLSALFAFNYPNKAGILSITGTDCEQFGNINVVGSTAQITFHKGYIIVYGKAIYIEEGTEVAFNLPSSGSVSGVLGVKINLAENGVNEVVWFQKTTTTQTDNLLQKPSTGVYEFVLYNYTATANTFVLGAKTTEIINNIDVYLATKLKDYFTIQTHSTQSYDLTLKLTKFPNSSLVIGEIDGYLLSRGNPSIVLNYLLPITNSNFYPKEEVKVFDSGANGDAKSSPYAQVLIFSDTDAANNYRLQVISGGKLTTNGILSFSVEGNRAGSSNVIIKHPFHYIFTYESV